ncbi:MAG: hypothetical protein AAB488_01165 [Patescibacteria group bacterium]
MERPQENLENKFPEKIRISVSNLLKALRVEETGEIYFIAMRGKPIKIEGVEKPRYQALGGGAKVTREGREKIEKEFGASFGISGRPSEENDDARFFVPLPENLRSNDKESEAERNKFISEVLSEFSEGNKELFELDITRELKEDLVSSEVISEKDFDSISTNYTGTISPILWKEATSERMSSEIPSYRLFHLHDAVIPSRVFEKIRNSPEIRVLSKSDIDAVKLATQEGKPTAITDDGGVIVENIFPDYHG